MSKVKFSKTRIENDNQYEQYNGMEFEIIRPLVKGVEYDYFEGESSEMFLIRLENGMEIHVFEEEIFEMQTTEEALKTALYTWLKK